MSSHRLWTLFSFTFVCLCLVAVPVLFPDSVVVLRSLLLSSSKQGTTNQGNDPSSSHSGPSGEQDSTEKAASKSKRKLSPLELKFAIDGPHVHYRHVGDDDDVESEDVNPIQNTDTTNIIYLDYRVGDWVTRDVIHYEIYDYDCKEVINASNSSSNSAYPPMRVLEPEKLQDDATDLSEDADSTLPDDRDPATTAKKSLWRLTLELLLVDEQENPSAEEATSHEDEGSSTVSSSVAHQYQFCVRWMLFSLPRSNEYSMETTFEQTQLKIVMDHSSSALVNERRPRIQTLEVSKPDPVDIQVRVDGRGRATVVRPEKDGDDVAAKKTGTPGAASEATKQENGMPPQDDEL